MPLMRWDAFHESHHRPFMVFADVDGRVRTRFALLSSLVAAMDLKGSYALNPEEERIRVAFERDIDAQKFADAVKARKTAREGGWAGQWAFIFNAEMEATIKSLLSPASKRQTLPR
jgi:hypothetical protein